MKYQIITTEEGPRMVAVTSQGLLDLHSLLPKYSVDDVDLGSVDLMEMYSHEAIRQRMASMEEMEVTSQNCFVKATGYLPVVKHPGKIIGVGLNYREHAAEMGDSIPEHPVIFSKFSTAINCHEGNVLLPKSSAMVDYEAELVVMIGRKGHNILERDALSYVAGYMCGNDISARDWQLKYSGGQWTLGKSFNTFAPVGPYLVTSREIPDPSGLEITMRLNGQVMQHSNTRNMIFSVPMLISHISRISTLEVGDLIFTGTPPGVGVGRHPQIFLKSGDVMEVEIEKIGVLKNRVVSQMEE